ncbi:hypothetical protein GCM10020331_067630 [Ectobacillus funiculus]
MIITDVGSTKERIMERARVLHEKGITFIGGHPMAGSHKTGAGSAKAHLFEKCFFYILTPFADTKNEKVEQLKEWLKGTKSTIFFNDGCDAA